MSTQEQTQARLEAARLLVNALELGDLEAADKAQTALAERREMELLEEIRRLTSAMRKAFAGLVTDRHLATLAKDDIPDARERLQFVIDKTEAATHATLSSVEHMMPTVETLVGRSTELLNTSPDDGAMAKQYFEFIEQVRLQGDDLRSSLTDVMMAQEFQDLTGQVIKRIMELVHQVERRLVQLVPAGVLEEIEADVAAENGSNDPERATIAEQQDVDDLLADLGV